MNIRAGYWAKRDERREVQRSSECKEVLVHGRVHLRGNLGICFGGRVVSVEQRDRVMCAKVYRAARPTARENDVQRGALNDSNYVRNIHTKTCPAMAPQW